MSVLHKVFLKLICGGEYSITEYGGHLKRDIKSSMTLAFQTFNDWIGSYCLPSIYIVYTQVRTHTHHKHTEAKYCVKKNNESSRILGGHPPAVTCTNFLLNQA
jgi:hypothetical protein